jgi:hypothetical protein
MYPVVLCFTIFGIRVGWKWWLLHSMITGKYSVREPWAPGIASTLVVSGHGIGSILK